MSKIFQRCFRGNRDVQVCHLAIAAPGIGKNPTLVTKQERGY